MKKSGIEDWSGDHLISVRSRTTVNLSTVETLFTLADHDMQGKHSFGYGPFPWIYKWLENTCTILLMVFINWLLQRSPEDNLFPSSWGPGVAGDKWGVWSLQICPFPIPSSPIPPFLLSFSIFTQYPYLSCHWIVHGNISPAFKMQYLELGTITF